MKAFFFVLLVVSIVFPVYSFMTSLSDFAHNQYKTRSERLADTTRPELPSAHLGLTAAQLAGLDELVGSAYKDAVYDGYRLGNGYEKLWFQALGVDALLFVASVAGLRRCRSSERPTNQMQ
jgi:hypothetical protein